METILNLGAAGSAFASALGCAAGASRLVYAYCRDGWGPTKLAETSNRGAPVNALAAVMALSLTTAGIIYLAWTRVAIEVFFYVGTTADLSLLIAYVVASAGAFRYLFLAGTLRAPRWEMPIPC